MTKQPEHLRRLSQRWRRWLLLALAILAAVAALSLIRSQAVADREQAAFEQLVAVVQGPPNYVNSPSLPSPSFAAPASAAATSTQPDLRALQAKNPDCLGWLTIPGTAVDYPVMYTPDEPEYYLRRAFDGSYAHSGVPLVGAGYTPDGDCLLIYGHNMKNGTMFSDLLRYQEQAYAQAHPLIEWSDASGTASYQVLAAFSALIPAARDQAAFRYYAYGGQLTEARFDEFITQVQAAALYHTGATAAWGDRLLVLSTCDRRAENRRFVVVARKCSFLAHNLSSSGK